MSSDAPPDPRAAPASPAPPSAPEAATASAGRGVLWISAAKILFVLLGFAVQFGLPRALEGPAEFGLLSAAIAFTVILTNAMTTSMVQTTSKLVAQAGEGSIVRVLALRHGVIALGLALIVLGSAEYVGSRVLSNAALTPLVRLASVVVVAYAIYATAIGALNGARAFDRQARLDATFSVVRTLGLLGGGLALGLASSAMTGFACAASVMALVGVIAARLHEAPSAQVPSLVEHLRVLLPIALYQLALNGVLQLDLEVLVTGATLEATQSGLDELAAAEAGAHAAGLYRVAQTLSFVPYQLMTSITLVLFPLVAHASGTGDGSAVRETVQAALRFSLLFVLGLLAPLAGAGDDAVRLAFPAAYADAAEIVPVLALSQVFFAMGVIQATVLVGRGRLWRTVGFAAAGLGVALAGNVLAWHLTPESLPIGTAWGTAGGSLVFALLGAYALRVDVGASVRHLVLGRAVLASLVAFGVARSIHVEGRVAGLGVLIVAGLAYLAVLAITRELGASEVALVRRVLGRRSAR
ncbi:MAG: polysaccharide biosynthesis C-terminal domain-containing protein [Deltaproteobacteria bacterium]|nr:polysaccharide biosynthesis C-terminal domain-containing protein [Deltaproteobacteria bacterium]